MLPDEETEALDLRIISGDELSEELSLAEHDLAEDYLEGELSPEEAARFDTHFLTSPERKALVREVRIFKGIAARKSESRKTEAGSVCASARISEDLFSAASCGSGSCRGARDRMVRFFVRHLVAARGGVCAAEQAGPQRHDKAGGLFVDRSCRPAPFAERLRRQQGRRKRLPRPFFSALRCPAGSRIT